MAAPIDELLDEDQRTALLIGQLEARPTATCARCGAHMCAHQTVIAHAMGFKDRMTCAKCISEGLGKPLDGFLEHVLRHISHRECFLQGWKWASRFHGMADELRPRSLFPNASAREQAPITPDSSGDAPREAGVDERWDAGDMGCGDLVLELRIRLAAMAPGTVLEVRATDPGAPEDIPAWCGMTGHGLIAAAHPRYQIRRRPDR